MNKLLIAIATGLIAASTLFASAAEAGSHGGFRRHFHNFHFSNHHRSDSYDYEYKKRSLKAAAIARAKANARAKAVAAAQAKARAIAAAKSEARTADPVEVAEVEQSSISSGSPKVAEVDVEETTEVATATRELGCKKFFPSAGVTLTVACD